MKRNSWQVWLAVILVAAMAGAGWYYWKKANKPPSVGKTVTVKRGMIRSLVQATGSVAAVNAVDISAKITGRIVEVRAAENDVVTAGQVVIVLDDMKMETPVVAPVGGTVRAVLVKVGDAVDEGSSLLQIEG